MGTTMTPIKKVPIAQRMAFAAPRLRLLASKPTHKARSPKMMTYHTSDSLQTHYTERVTLSGKNRQSCTPDKTSTKLIQGVPFAITCLEAVPASSSPERLASEARHKSSVKGVAPTPPLL